MQHIAMVFAAVMMAAGSVTYVAQAADGDEPEAVDFELTAGMKAEATPEPGAVLAETPSYSSGDAGAVIVSELKAAKAAAEAEAARLAAEEQARQEKAARDAVAASSFGQWGPWLVEAGAMYGQDPAELYRVMQCESGGDPNASNGGQYLGLFQFHPGTWASTPYGGASIYDGPSQIMAAAWMWSQGRQNEWSCY